MLYSQQRCYIGMQLCNATIDLIAKTSFCKSCYSHQLARLEVNFYRQRHEVDYTHELKLKYHARRKQMQ